MNHSRRIKHAKKSSGKAIVERKRLAQAATFDRRVEKKIGSGDTVDNKIPKPMKIRDRCDYEVKYHAFPTKEEIEEKMPFCCAICHCSEELRSEAEDVGLVSGVVFPDNDHLWHRICCHGAFDCDDEWVCPYVELSLQAVAEPEEVKDKPALERVSESNIRDAYKSAKSQEPQIYKAGGEVFDKDKLFTSKNYISAVEQPYKTLIQARQHEKPRRAVVLDCFAGVGTLIVVLKRLRIDISKVVHVEHDKVATHVYRYNHDHDYNPKVPQDDIEHVFFEKFEELEPNLEVILAKHGPFDIVVGGPPCSDFSKDNTFRKGVDGQQGQYMLDFGRLIRTIEKLQRPHPLMFLAENVPLQGDDLATAQQAFEMFWDPVEFDALYVSPIRRRRVFFTNIPLPFGDFGSRDVASKLGPSSCLEKGFVALAHIVDQEDNARAKKIEYLMASPTRLDERTSLRMYVFMYEDGKYIGRPLECVERENLMGHPKEYVEKPVEVLFKELHVNGLSLQRRENALYLKDKPWKMCLPKKYHHFAGNYHQLPVKDPYRLKLLRSSPTDNTAVDLIQIKMAPPLLIPSSTPTFYLDEEYVKYLIGNAFSVPVVELLLGPLKILFGTRLYQRFEYKYAWYDDLLQILQHERHKRSNKQAVNNLHTVSTKSSNKEHMMDNQVNSEYSVNNEEVQEDGDENAEGLQLVKNEVLEEETAEI